MGTLECVVSVSVWFRSKKRLKNGIFGFWPCEKWTPPPPCCFTCPIFLAVFDSRSSFLASKRTEMLAMDTQISFKYFFFLYHQILSKISAAWQWTVCRRVGLFAADQKVDSPLAVFSDDRSPPTAPNVSPHDIWIKFLARRFEVIKYYSRDQVGWYWQCHLMLSFVLRINNPAGYIWVINELSSLQLNISFININWCYSSVEIFD